MEKNIGIPIVVQRKWIQLVSTRMQFGSLALLHGSAIWGCCEMWCRSQTQLGSCIAVAMVQAGSWSSDLTPTLATSICHGCGPKKKQKRNKKRTFKKIYILEFITINFHWSIKLNLYNREICIHTYIYIYIYTTQCQYFFFNMITFICLKI